MTDDRIYEAWKRDRSRADVPDGFADEVMERVARRQVKGKSRWVPILLCATAGLAGIARVAAVLSLLLTE